MRVILLLALLAGCSPGESVDPKRWACTKVGTYVDKDGILAGTAYMEVPVKRTGCVQWTRMEFTQ